MNTTTAQPEIISISCNWPDSTYQINYRDSEETEQVLNVDFRELEALMDGEVTYRYIKTEGCDEGYFRVLNRDALIQYDIDYVKMIALQFINSKN